MSIRKERGIPVKQTVNPVVAAVLAVIAFVGLSFIGYHVYTSAGSSSLPTANPQPLDPNDEKYKSRLPPGISGGGGG